MEKGTIVGDGAATVGSAVERTAAKQKARKALGVRLHLGMAGPQDWSARKKTQEGKESNVGHNDAQRSHKISDPQTGKQLPLGQANRWNLTSRNEETKIDKNPPKVNPLV